MGIDNKKAAIVTLYDDINLGNKLQNYALQEVLKKFLDCKTVDTLSYSEAKENTSDKLSWKGKLVLALGYPRKKALEKRKMIERRKKFERFSSANLNVVDPKPFHDFGKFENSKYDYFIVGSDQVWHGWMNTEEELNYFFLKFASPEKRICFAPSFGFNEVPENNIKLYIDGLNGFRFLSCREESGCELIRQMTGKDAVLLPDPTIVLPVEEWRKLERKPDYELPEKYILSYFLGEQRGIKNTKLSEDISIIAEKSNLPVIDIFDKTCLYYYATDPCEFLYLIRNAELVLTNSFHCAVFSILNRKKFKLFSRNDSDGKKMSSRGDTLLKEFHLFPDRDGFIDNFDDVEQIILEKRRLSEKYLEMVFQA